MTVNRASTSAAPAKKIAKKITKKITTKITTKNAAKPGAPGDWRTETLAAVRLLIQSADPDITEELKWAKASSPGVPVWSHHGIVCTGETYKQVVKLTFARGASLHDPHKLFNASLEGGTRRAIDIRDGETLNKAAFTTLIETAVLANSAALAQRSKKK